MSDTTEAPAAKRDRSPPFPFIPLDKAVERAMEFANEFKKHPARVSNAVAAWHFGPKSSGGIQTIAALKAFGLLDDIGGGDDRKVQLTELAWRIILARQEEIRQKALAEAALKPRPIAEHWAIWGADRPADAGCLDDLMFEKSFTEEAAKRFLKVYDATIGYAKLAGSDKVSLGGQDVLDQPAEPVPTIGVYERPAPPPQPRASLMPGEREVFAHEIGADRRVRLIVSGHVDMDLLDALEAYVNFQKVLVKRQGERKQAEIAATAEVQATAEVVKFN